jgi:hypothetical protein
MIGGTINILGSTNELDSSTFDFTEESIALGEMFGKIVFDGGQFAVTGDYASLLDTAIAYGNIYTNVEGKVVDAQYAEGFTTLQLIIPEPLTLAILGLGTIFIRRRR